MFDSFSGAEFTEIRILKFCPMITSDPHNGTILFPLKLCA